MIRNRCLECGVLYIIYNIYSLLSAQNCLNQVSKFRLRDIFQFLPDTKSRGAPQGVLGKSSCEGSRPLVVWVTPLGGWQRWPLACLGLGRGDRPIILGRPTAALLLQLPPRSGRPAALQHHCLVSFYWLWCYGQHQALVPCTAAVFMRTPKQPQWSVVE